MIWWFTGAAVVLAAFGGLMAAIEAALGVTSRIELAELSQRSRSRRALERITADVGAHQNAVAFVRVVAEMTAAVLVTLALSVSIDDWWLALLLAAMIMTGVSFVLVGSSPRSVGRAHASGLLAGTAGLIRAVRIILGPLAGTLVALGDRVTPGRTAGSSVSSEEQLLHLVDEAAEQEVLDSSDRELIHSIFDFSDTLVREVMIPRPDMVTVDGDDLVSDAMVRFLERGVSRMPVMGDGSDDVLGVLYLRDVARLQHERPGAAEAMPVQELARSALFVPESQKADAALRQMQLDSNHLAMVVDEYGGIAGLVTMEDLIEELIGEISDEYDRTPEEVQDLGDGRFRVAARLPLDELGELYGLELEDEEVDSVGGLLGKELSRVPTRGSTTEVAGLILTAERVERRRVTTILVEPTEALREVLAAMEAEARERAEERAGERAREKAEERARDRATERERAERTAERAADRGADRAAERATERGADRVQEVGNG